MIGLERSQQALFALLDSLAKIPLTCIPEPDIHAEAAVARAQGPAGPIGDKISALPKTRIFGVTGKRTNLDANVLT